MNCVICKQGQTYLGTTTVTLEREGAIACLGGARIAIFKQEPAEICENCGEYHLSEVVTGGILERTENVTKSTCFCY
ncbi:MAG: YgiT-type zinc finger protein [Elainellaceae cyanobacterium]